MPLLVAVRGSRLCCWGLVRVAGQWRAPGSRVLGLTEHITSPWSEVPRPSLAPQVPGGPAPGTQTSFPPIFTALCSSHTGRLSVPQMFRLLSISERLLWWGPGNRIFTESADDFNAQFLRTSASKDYIFKVCLLLLCSVTMSYLTLWPHGLYVAHLAPLSTRFPRQGYWRGLPFPSPGDLPRPGIKPVSPVLATWEASYKTVYVLYFIYSHSRLLFF